MAEMNRKKIASDTALPPLNINQKSGVPKAKVDIISGTRSFRGKISDEEIGRLREIDRQPVRGIFRNFESPNVSKTFIFNKYKADPMEAYTLKDGEEVTIPRGVAHHLIENGTIHTFKHSVDKLSGRVIKKPMDIRRYTFESTAFLDEMKSSKRILTLV